ncbi:hypothetical protein EDEG_01789 [Edhazardia aedis USNM 41457]|uniref:Transmembrane protein n=1 Tax=Edhazardia aedis (strain USNM 41457) TaxID=1003232 RepID=J9D7Z2_EDHAE|nr:hypothetical protein EDEG_01789 [Edhazardia aedis USNM 41457]|eukprot:EJW03911.1 hypothetical protein EDEG_01789 [Edhazardia aedis USNM 41457]
MLISVDQMHKKITLWHKVRYKLLIFEYFLAYSCLVELYFYFIKILFSICSIRKINTCFLDFQIFFLQIFLYQHYFSTITKFSLANIKKVIFKKIVMMNFQKM